MLDLPLLLGFHMPIRPSCVSLQGVRSLWQSILLPFGDTCCIDILVHRSDKLQQHCQQASHAGRPSCVHCQEGCQALPGQQQPLQLLI